LVDFILLQHAEEAAILWVQRDAAVRAPHYDLQTLERHDDRLAAHLDGLLVGAEAAGEVLREQFAAFPEAGEAFAAAWHALACGGRARFEEVVDAAAAADAAKDPADLAPPAEDAPRPGALRAVASALGWAEPGLLGGLVADHLGSDDVDRRRLALAACALHRRDPGEALAAALDDPEPRVRARAAKAAGELGRADLAPALVERLGAEDAEERFHAAWSASRLGARAADDVLAAFATANGPFAARAADAAPRFAPPGEALARLRGLRAAADREPALARRVVQAVGAYGDPAFLPWLLERMDEPRLARVAGEAAARITGWDLSYDDLEADPPDGAAAGPTDDPADPDVSPDPDADLPWPDAAGLARRLAGEAGAHPSGERRLGGRPVGEAAALLAAGPQRARRAAALEIGAADPRAALFPWAARAASQRAARAASQRAALVSRAR